MNISQLDAFVAQHALNSSQVDSALNLTGNRPTTPEWRAFAAKSLLWAGVTAIVCAAIFFIAANWQHMGPAVRFAMVQALLIASLALAWHQAAIEGERPQQIFNVALTLATFFTGTLLALFGQTYQTGADVYELFFAWALLTLPFALAAKSGALWIIWACILNVGLALLCGFGKPGNFGWRLFDRMHMNEALVLMIPFFVNGLGAVICILKAPVNPPIRPIYGNLQRVLLTFTIIYGTLACLSAMHGGWAFREKVGHGITEVGILLLLILSCAALARHTIKMQRDVYPLALIAACALTVSTAYIIKITIGSHDFGAVFFIGFWIIASSTVAGIMLMRYVRAWQPVAEPEPSISSKTAVVAQ